MNDIAIGMDPEDLAAHSDRLRALVSRLVADPGRVDDLVQETHVVALTHTRRPDVPLRAWLVGIARNLVRRERRTTERRARREALARRPIGVPAAADLVEKADLIRVLIAELVALDEPYRETLLLRFVEGLEPRDIADRTGVPRGTVRSRLKRGLELVRSRLDARHGGDRRRWLSLCIPVLSARPGSGSTAAGGGTAAAMGVMVMTMKTWAGAVVLLLLASGAIWLARRQTAPEPAGPIVAVRDRDAHEHAPGADPDRTRRGESTDEQAPAGDSRGAPSAPAATPSMQIRVRRADGLSAAGTHVVAWHDDVVDWSVDAGVDGIAELPRSDVARRAVVAAPSHPLVWTEIPAGASVHEVVVLADASVEGVVRVDGLAPRESVQVKLALADGTPWAVADVLPPAVWARLGLWTSDVPAQTDADGRFVFTGLAPGRSVHVVIPRGLVFRDPEAHPYRFVESDVPAQGVFLDLLSLPRFTGRVVTSDGLPVKSAVVMLTGEHDTGGFSSNVTTDADGRFVVCALFLEVHSLALTITDAGGKAQRRVPIDAAPGPSRDLGDVRLAEIRTVVVRVRDVEGRPVSGAIALESHQVVSDAPTDAEGRTTLRVWGDPPRVRVGASGFVSAPLDVATGAEEPIDVVLSRAAVLEVNLNGGPGLRLESFRLDLSSLGALFDSPRGTYDEIASLTGGATPVAEGSTDGRSARIRLEARDRPDFLVSGLRAAVPVRLRLLDVVGTVHADREITLAAGERRVVVLDVAPSRPFRGTVVDGAGIPIANACVQPSQADAADDWVTVSGPPVLTTRDGRFAFDEIRADRLRVVVSKAGHPVWTHSGLDVPASGRDLIVRLEPARSLRVTLRDAQDVPVDDAVVLAERAAPGEDGATASSRPGRVDDGGICRFDDVPLGSAVVVVKLGSGEEVRFPVADGAQDVTLTLPRAK